MAKPGAGIFLVPRDLSALVAARGVLTYAEVASAAGCTKGYVHKLLHGDKGRVTVEMAASIEDALGVPRGSLFTVGPADAQLLAPYSAELCRIAS